MTPAADTSAPMLAAATDTKPAPLAPVKSVSAKHACSSSTRIVSSASVETAPVQQAPAVLAQAAAPAQLAGRAAQ
ncbi:MAG: hypothetical protein NTX21_03365 [Alphaproteobacteria bacterium]|nr:hypothetical protein [Alphaproteobacteria bacterium]